MTQDNPRAAEIVVEKRHKLLASMIGDAARDHANPNWFDRASKIAAEFERDHMQRPTDTARAGAGWSFAEKLMNWINSLDTSEMTVKEFRSQVYGWAIEYRPTPSPVTDETALSGELLTYDQMRSGGRCDFRQLREAVSEATCGNRQHAKDPPEHLYPGHAMVDGINYNSLDRIVTAFVDAALASTPQPAVAEETLDEKLRPLLLAFEDFLNEPPRIWDIEPMEVRDYRHEAYRKWEPLCREILAAIRQGQNEEGR